MEKDNVTHSLSGLIMVDQPQTQIHRRLTIALICGKTTTYEALVTHDNFRTPPSTLVI